MIPPPSFWKKWIFSHFLFDSIFSEYQETLADYKSVGMWAGREAAFVFSSGFCLRNSKPIHEAKHPRPPGRDTGPKGFVLNPFPT